MSESRSNPASPAISHVPISRTDTLTLDDYKTIYSLKLEGKTHKQILEKIDNKVPLARISEVVNGKAVTSQAKPLYEDFQLARKFPEVYDMVREGVEALKNGDYVEYTDENIHEFFDDIKRRGRERWASKSAPAPAEPGTEHPGSPTPADPRPHAQSAPPALSRPPHQPSEPGRPS